MVEELDEPDGVQQELQPQRVITHDIGHDGTHRVGDGLIVSIPRVVGTVEDKCVDLRHREPEQVPGCGRRLSIL